MSHYYYLHCLTCNPDPKKFWVHTSERLNRGADDLRLLAKGRLKIVEAANVLNVIMSGSMWELSIHFDGGPDTLIDFLITHAAHRIGLTDEYLTSLEIIDPAR